MAAVFLRAHSPGLPWLGFAALLLALAVPSAVRAQGGKQDGLVLPVPNVIGGETYAQLERAVRHAIEREGRKIEVVIFDFNPNGQPSTTSVPGPCISLKNTVQKMHDPELVGKRQIKTIAYLRNEVSGYSILPVLACDEIVMAKGAKLGNLGGGKMVPAEADVSFQKLADLKPSPDAVLKLRDGNTVLVPVKTDNGGKQYVSLGRVKQAAAEGKKPFTALGDPEADPPSPLLTWEQARRYDLTGDSCETLDSLVAQEPAAVPGPRGAVAGP